MFTREIIETALDAGQIETEMNSGRWWRLRRNGMTKTWKTRPGEFRIPVKAGLRACAYIDHSNMNSGHYRLMQG